MPVARKCGQSQEDICSPGWQKTRLRLERNVKTLTIMVDISPIVSVPSLGYHMLQLLLTFLMMLSLRVVVTDCVISL